MAGSAKISGFKELSETIRALGKTPGKAVLRRAGKKALEPMAASARSKVRVDFGDLRDSIHVGTRLSASQREQRAPGRIQPSKDDVRVHMGPRPSTSSITEEFGKFNEAGHPYMRPAFDAEAPAVAGRIGPELWADIAKTAARAAKKKAKAGGA